MSRRRRRGVTRPWSSAGSEAGQEGPCLLGQTNQFRYGMELELPHQRQEMWKKSIGFGTLVLTQTGIKPGAGIGPLALRSPWGQAKRDGGIFLRKESSAASWLSASSRASSCSSLSSGHRANAPSPNRNSRNRYVASLGRRISSPGRWRSGVRRRILCRIATAIFRNAAAAARKRRLPARIVTTSGFANSPGLAVPLIQPSPSVEAPSTISASTSDPAIKRR